MCGTCDVSRRRRLHLDETKLGPRKSVQKPFKSSLGARGGNKCRSRNFPSSRTSHGEQLEALPHKRTCAAEQGRGSSVWPGLQVSPNRGCSGASPSKRSDWGSEVFQAARAASIWRHEARGAGSLRDVTQVKSQPGARERPNGNDGLQECFGRFPWTHLWPDEAGTWKRLFMIWIQQVIIWGWSIFLNGFAFFTLRINIDYWGWV